MTEKKKPEPIKFPDLKTVSVIARMRTGLQLTRERHAKRKALKLASLKK